MFGMASQKDLEVMDEFFEEFLEFVMNKRNQFNFSKQSSNNNVNKILEKWTQKSAELDTRMKNDMRVMGEIVLTTDKIEQGIFKCRINSDTENSMLMTLKINMNKMLDVTQSTMDELSRILNLYSNNDFREKLVISEHMKEDMLDVMKSVNKLGEALSLGAKENLTNGEHLEASAATMTDSVNNLADKANQQAASLEQTAAAVEEITSITSSQVKEEYEKGNIDVINGTSPSMDIQLGYHKIAPYYYTSWDKPAYQMQFLINKKAFEKLPQSYKAILKIAMKTAAYDVYYENFNSSSKAWEKILTEYPNIEVKSFSKEIIEKLYQAKEFLFKSYAKENKLFNEIYEDQKIFLKRVRPLTKLQEYSYIKTTE